MKNQLTSTLGAVSWHVLAALSIPAVAALRFGMPFWGGGSALTPAHWLVGSYGVAVGFLTYQEWRRSNSFLVTLVTAIAAVGAVSTYIVAADAEASRVVLGGGSLAALACLVAYFGFPRLRLVSGVGLLIALIGITVMAKATEFTLRPVASSASEQLWSSAFYSLRMTVHRNVLPPTATYFSMGAISPLRGGYVIMTGEGSLYWIPEIESEGDIEVQPLSIGTPVNRADFLAASGGASYAQYFRAMDILVRERDGATQLLASHHYWNDADACTVLRVSETRLDSTQPLPDQRPEWKTLYETTPCFPLEDETWAFRGMESGGRLAFLDDSTLLVTVGDHGFNGEDYEADWINDLSAAYGKTMLVDLDTGESRVFTVGHRNQQGLWVDVDGVVWSTEHGPQGGDELNVLEEGIHYGWPQETYGTEYGERQWPLSRSQGRHDEFRRPVLAWLPAIGISNLIRIGEGTAFPIWKNDLLVSSLRGMDLQRLRIQEGRVIFAERIAVGERIRDLTESPDGELVLWTDQNAIVLIEPGDELPAETQAESAAHPM